VSLEGATRKGSAAAPVVLIEYTDYRCSFCAKEERDALPEITRKYVDAGQVELAVRHHPLENLHPGATALAVAALCAGQQNRFWEMHQALFENHTDTSEELIMRLAHRLLVDDAKFSACLSTQVRDQVQHDVKEAEQLGLKGTPTFLVGYREVDGRVKVVAVINGAQPVEAFARAFEKAAAR
jgi:protein-disulfide isomerase